MKERQLRLMMGAAAAGVLLASCMSVNLEASGVDAPVSMSSEINRDYRVVERFRQRTSAWFHSLGDHHAQPSQG